MAARVGPEVAEELRTEHFGLLRGALERTGGSEVKNLGDGLMGVFDSAVQSLACAVAMQQAIEVRNRRAEEQLGIRIGVSLGETTAEDGDYFGEPVVESARLCARAGSGQIIVNDLVHRLAGSRDGHSFKSLGGLELKGISAPVEAFELQWEPAAVVGLALPERLRDLPATADVGREPERERMAELWERAQREKHSPYFPDHIEKYEPFRPLLVRLALWRARTTGWRGSSAKLVVPLSTQPPYAPGEGYDTLKAESGGHTHNDQHPRWACLKGEHDDPGQRPGR